MRCGTLKKVSADKTLRSVGDHSKMSFFRPQRENPDLTLMIVHGPIESLIGNWIVLGNALSTLLKFKNFDVTKKS